jgi:hypothetical protein
MALVLKPPQRRLLPNGKLKIDWSHPLAKGLIACFLPGISYQDLSGNCPDLTLNQNPSSPIPPFGVGPEGPVLTGAFANTSGSILTCLAPSQFKNWNNLSLYFRGPRGNGNGVGGLPYFFYVSYTSGVGSPFSIASIGDSNNTDLSTVGIEYNDGSSNQKTAGTVNLSAATQISVLGTLTVAGNNILYSNGVQVGSNAWVGSSQAITTSTDMININGWVATGRYSPTNCYIACAWNRALSASEAALLMPILTAS